MTEPAAELPPTLGEWLEEMACEEESRRADLGFDRWADDGGRVSNAELGVLYD